MNQHQRLQSTITQIEGTYASATIRAYAADFATFIRFAILRTAPLCLQALLH
jgi:hypothetical protein